VSPQVACSYKPPPHKHRAYEKFWGDNIFSLVGVHLHNFSFAGVNS
jgi:hypothetical protein